MVNVHRLLMNLNEGWFMRRWTAAALPYLAIAAVFAVFEIPWWGWTLLALVSAAGIYLTWHTERSLRPYQPASNSDDHQPPEPARRA